MTFVHARNTVTRLALGALLTLFFAFLINTDAQALTRFCKVRSAGAAKEAQASPTQGAAASRRGRAVLLSEKAIVHPGERLNARVANFSQRPVTYGEEFALQRWTGSSWERDPASPAGPWSLVGYPLKPGQAGRCYNLTIPRDQPEGRYRIMTDLYVHLDQQSRESVVAASFRVE
jgi:hypothetical protein